MSGPFPDDSAERKTYPVYSGVFQYFPAALARVARHSFIGNAKHNPGQPLHHARGKSDDHLDAAGRHLIEGDLVGAAWRILAALQLQCEAEGAPLAPGAIPPPPQIVPHAVAAAFLRDRAEQDDDLPGHPFQDTDALTGHVTAPIGAQSGGVVDVTKGAYVPNPINQADEE